MSLVSLSVCKRRLALLWFAGFTPAFVLFFIQWLNVPEYRDNSKEAWGWFLASIVPTFSLVTASYLQDAFRPPSAHQVEGAAIHMTLGISSLYIVVLLSLIAIAPYYSRAEPLEWLRTSSIVLALLQGVVSAFLGAFLGSQQEKAPA